MKQLFLPLMFVGSVIFISCGNGGEGDAETDTAAVTTTDTSILADTGIETGTTYSSTPLTGADTTFVKEAASGGMMEVEAGRLA